MTQKTKFDHLFKDSVLGHPAGLFVLFFTEMWERFSFYGMRVLLVSFLTMAYTSYNPGWEMPVENANALFGTYAGLLYLTPILGGIIADKLTGYRWAVVIGAFLMTLGHASMAVETQFSLYLGLGLIVVGTGFFKPNITSIISELYKDASGKKDSAYNIFYMGVNAGAFFGMLLCGYLAATYGWSYGFGLAGIFMLLGTLQFWLAKPLFGKIGDVPSKVHEVELPQNINEENVDHVNTATDEKSNPFTLLDKILIFITSTIGLLYLINDPLSKIGGIDLYPFQVGGLSGQVFMILVGLILFLFLVISRILRYSKVVRDRMLAFIIFAFFTVFFWMSFEQGASSLILFARDSVDRILSGTAATIFNVIDALLAVIPLIIITWVLFLLGKKTFRKISWSNIILIICFLSIWTIVIWKINSSFNTQSYTVQYEQIQEDGTIEQKTTSITETFAPFKVNDKIAIIRKVNDASLYGYVNSERAKKITEIANKKQQESNIIQAQVISNDGNQIEIEVSWFSILNSFFIIAFASLFSKWWESKYNPSAALKFGLGLIVMAVGFGFLAFGSYGISDGIKVSMIWLIFAYLFHTLGELCLSPIGLSYVSKLVPARMIALMFGMWYLAIAIGNKLAAVLGGEIENITHQYSLSTFFLIFTIVPIIAGILVILLNPALKKIMHGVR